MQIQKSNINSTFQGAFSIGKSPRSDLFEINNSPSPQHYQLNTTDNLKKYNSPKWTYEPKLVKQPKKNKGLNFPGRYDHINIIQTDQSPGPGQYNPKYDKTFSDSFQYFNKEVRFKNKLGNNNDDNIGPGQYNIVSDIDKYVKDENKKFTFGQKYDPWKYEKYENKPHPGYYNKIYDYKDSKPKFTKQKQTGLTTSMRYQAKIQEGPGPQNYQIKSKFNSDLGPVIKENIYQNIANQNKLSPGPGKYIINTGSYEKNKGITIGKKTKIIQVENISPGVGFYNQKSFFGKNNQAVKFSKGLQLDKLQNSVISEPGPGQYTIGSSFGAIPNYLMQKKQSQQSINSEKLSIQS
ncbi:hypothetical protein PPERSA_10622 [Pseudocohnilembus persalinus]|uniref:Sperm-tail PG-rich repeat n=1 Tax=Pseudocohnilembus persalinus TaxID=266149 RepID=A0A0V0QD46_PSEPJ|nr:hypothetical protein PPERSA_10622 [Pseudocohnilembus persalinus]|eukprot:KRX00123.1 hypothetical protein PPERSA_10622 [Pseudocohnilembus persalinus]